MRRKKFETMTFEDLLDMVREQMGDHVAACLEDRFELRLEEARDTALLELTLRCQGIELERNDDATP